MHTRDGGLGGLVDVHLDRRLTASGLSPTSPGRRRRTAGDEVNAELFHDITKKNCGILTMVEQNHAASPRQRLDKLDALRIILLVNFVIIREGRVFGFVFEVLESSSVERYRVLLPPQILDDNVFTFTSEVPLPLACDR